MNGMFIAEPKYGRERTLYGDAKAASDGRRLVAVAKAESRQSDCWRVSVGCTGKPVTWVTEVGFDRLRLDGPLDRPLLRSDHDGPVPGFCAGCLHSAPQELARLEYMAHPVSRWG